MRRVGTHHDGAHGSIAMLRPHGTPEIHRELPKRAGTFTEREPHDSDRLPGAGAVPQAVDQIRGRGLKRPGTR
ncbi:hypothetical protein HMPREF9057_02470 [Actinomyces sp. oral taxon 171 str. F0337]|nr:hypothetical protein HMPREF9057_02470 [Actinomyces sp. oral taxon 171 str. F0337]